MGNELIDVPIAVDEGFAVRDAASANWVIRKVLEARAYADRVKAWAAIEQRRAQREEAFLLHRFGKQLEEWARQQINQQHDRRRSVNLPAGAVGFRTESTRLTVTNESQLLTWCNTHLPGAIRTTKSIAKTPLMQHIKSTGECPEGAEIVGGSERFCISPKKIESNKGVGDGLAEEQ